MGNCGAEEPHAGNKRSLPQHHHKARKDARSCCLRKVFSCGGGKGSTPATQPLPIGVRGAGGGRWWLGLGGSKQVFLFPQASCAPLPVNAPHGTRRPLPHHAKPPVWLAMLFVCGSISARGRVAPAARRTPAKILKYLLRPAKYQTAVRPEPEVQTKTSPMGSRR